MDKQNVVYLYNGTLLDNKKNEVLVHAKRGWTLKMLYQVKEATHRRVHINEIPRIGKSRETENRLLVA